MGYGAGWYGIFSSVTRDVVLLCTCVAAGVTTCAMNIPTCSSYSMRQILTGSQQCFLLH